MSGDKEGFVRHRTGGHNACNLPFHGSLALARVTNLLADGHGFASAKEASQIALRSMVGYAGHGNRRPGGLASGGQGDVE